MKPFEEERDRIEAKFSKRMEDSTDDMDRKFEELLAGLNSTSQD